MISCDSSVLIAAFARWHEHHKEAADAVSQIDALIDQAVIEAFSVLTRLPPSRRAPAALVATFLRHHFPASVARLPGPPAGDVIRTAAGTGIAGGAVYDLLIGLTAADAGATLLSLDRRARPAYEAAGADHRILRSTG